MKRTKKDNKKWYLFVNGTHMKVADSNAEFSQLKGVVLEITPHEAATILSLILEEKADE